MGDDRNFSEMKRFLVLLPLFLWPDIMFGQLSATPVQSAVGDTGIATAASFTITFSSAPTAGNWIALAVVAAPGTKVTSSNTRWVMVTPPGNNVTTGSASILFIGYPGASAGTAITVSNVAATAVAMAGIAAEFKGVNIQTDSISQIASGNTASPAVTIAASGHLNAILISVMHTRGQLSAQSSIFTSPTNGFVYVDGSTGAAGVGQRNTTINTLNADRAVAMLIKVITDGASVSSGATMTSGQWGTSGVSLAQTQQGFFTD